VGVVCLAGERKLHFSAHRFTPEGTRTVNQCIVPLMGIIAIYSVWRVYAEWLKERQQRLRHRVAYMVWVAAQYCRPTIRMHHGIAEGRIPVAAQLPLPLHHGRWPHGIFGSNGLS
jgi:hypothetical protein